jgi:hypothetical protein
MPTYEQYTVDWRYIYHADLTKHSQPGRTEKTW